MQLCRVIDSCVISRYLRCVRCSVNSRWKLYVRWVVEIWGQSSQQVRSSDVLYCRSDGLELTASGTRRLAPTPSDQRRRRRVRHVPRHYAQRRLVHCAIKDRYLTRLDLRYCCISCRHISCRWLLRVFFSILESVCVFLFAYSTARHGNKRLILFVGPPGIIRQTWSVSDSFVICSGSSVLMTLRLRTYFNLIGAMTDL